MKLGSKIAATSGVSLLFLILLSLFILNILDSNKKSLNEIYNVAFYNFQLSKETLEYASDANIKSYRLFTWINNLNNDEVTEQTKEITSIIANAQTTIDKLLQNTGQDTQTQTLLNTIKTDLASYQKNIESAIDMAGIDINMGLSSMKTADEDFIRIRSQIEKVVQAANSKVKSQYDNQVAAADQVTWTSIIFVAIAILGSLLLAIAVSKHMVGRIRTAISTAKNIAMGELTHNIPVDGTDEISELLAAVAKMQEQLRGVVGSISHTTTRLGTISHTIHTSSNAILTSSESQNQSASTMANAVAQLSDSANAIGELATEVNQSMAVSAQLSVNERKILDAVIDSIKKIEDSAEENSKMVKSLGSESEKISNIIKVISDIAEQTNLLALNAAIEAARAGEQGRGFAVVADEVRGLAARTASSTREITDMIQAIQSRVAAAIKGIQSSVDAVSTGATLANEAQTAVENTANQVNSIAGKISHISEALHSQQENSRLISTQVSQVTHTAEKNLQATSSTVSELEELSALTHTLEETLRYFRC